MNPILLYDGDCPLCNHSILFLIKTDTSEVLRYASLDSDKAQNLLGTKYDAILRNDAVTLLYEDQIYVETDAIIQSLRIINKWIWLVHLMQIIPRFLSNGIYRIVARNRSKLFKSCPIIPAEYSHLFL